MNHFARTSLIALGCFASCCLALPGATTFYVAKNGSDSNSGTNASPWLTVQKAANNVTAGDTVNVATGSYPERVVISAKGTAEGKISFQTTGSVTIGGFYVTGAHVNIRDFTCNGTGVDLYDAAITYYYNAHFGAVNNCTIQGVPGVIQGAGGVYFYSDRCTADGLVLTNPNFHAIVLIGSYDTVKNFSVAMTTGWDVIRIVGSNDTIEDGSISASNPGDANENHCDIFQTFGNDPATVSQDVLIQRLTVSYGQGYQFGNITDDQENGNISRWTFRNNTFVDIERVMNLFAPDCSFLNNTFVRCGAGSGWVISIGSSGAGHSNNLTIKNNIFYQCGFPDRSIAGWYAGDAVSGTVADYNLVIGTGAGITKDATAWRNGIGGLTGTFEAHGLNGVDPLFVNPAAGNYNLQAGSPATGMGAAAVIAPTNAVITIIVQ